MPRLRPFALGIALVGLLALAGAAAGGTLRSPPAGGKTAAGGGPQTGTGTSDVVRSVTPPKNSG